MILQGRWLHYFEREKLKESCLPMMRTCLFSHLLLHLKFLRGRNIIKHWKESWVMRKVLPTITTIIKPHPTKRGRSATQINFWHNVLSGTIFPSKSLISTFSCLTSLHPITLLTIKFTCDVSTCINCLYMHKLPKSILYHLLQNINIVWDIVT